MAFMYPNLTSARRRGRFRGHDLLVLPQPPSRRGHDGCAYKDRLGPYDTEAEAARALEKVKERNEEWDNDPNWNDNELED